MIRSVADWRAAAEKVLPADAIPQHPELGVRYPWGQIVRHSLTSQHRRNIDRAMDCLSRAVTMGVEWRLGWSAGKDSTALACLLRSANWPIRAMSVKDDLDFPGEPEYLVALGARCGITVDILRPPVSLLGFLTESGIDMTEDLHSRRAELSIQWFYGLLDRYREEQGYSGAVLGLRSNESAGRAVNRATHGTLYTRRDGLTVSTPLADWQDIDVHAYLASQDVPILPTYLCIDDGVEPLRLRKSWYVAGGAMARRGHYRWLRRWWPDLWRLAVGADPRIACLS